MARTTITARRGDVKDVSVLASAVFGEMIKLSAPIVAHYHGDLYHDAMWLSEFLTGQRLDFAWSFDGNGTNIGTDESLVLRRRVWVRFTVTATNGNGVVEYDVSSRVD